MGWRTAILTWLGLLILLAVSVATTFLVPGTTGWTLNLACAAAMATLVLTFFMRLRYADALLRLFALGGLLWLGLLLFPTLLDVLTRR